VPLIHSTDRIAQLAYAVVVACLLGFGVIAAIGRRGAAKTDAKRDLKSSVGFLLQLLAYAMCFIFYRASFRALFPMPGPTENIFAAFTMLLAVVSTWFCQVSARALGRQWALMARVIEGHELIAQGPYALVRNPIYLAMFGMQIAAGLAFSSWQGFLAATGLFLAGTWIRIHTEEKLLRETFGAKFDSYARRVPALLPRLQR